MVQTEWFLIENLSHKIQIIFKYISVAQCNACVELLFIVRFIGLNLSQDVTIDSIDVRSTVSFDLRHCEV